MKILLINPAFYDGNAFKNRFDDYIDWIKGGNLYVAPFEPPLGLAYLSAFLKARGFQVNLLDMQGLLMDSEELVRSIADYSPDLIGITAMTPTVPEALRVAELARKTAPGAGIVLGGVHPTLDPASVLTSRNVDFVIRGEGEFAFAELAAALSSGLPVNSIEGVSYKEGGGRLVINGKAPLIKDLNSLSMADYEAFPIERYIEHNRHLRSIRGISMIISRGCPFQCTFCAVHETMGRTWRIKTAAQVVSEMVILKERHGIEGVWFKDSIFNLDKEWVREFCRLLIAAGTGIQWQALTRVDLINEEQIILMKQAGLTQLDLGIETGSPGSLIRLKKGITVERIKEQVAIAKRHVKVFGFFMIGIPGEEELDVQQTFELAKALNLDRWTWSIYSPLPGSALYEDLIAEGKIEPYRLDFNQVHFTEAYQGVCGIPPLRLKELYKEINDYFYRLHAQTESGDEIIDDGIYADL